MAKVRTVYRCSGCGAEAPRWQGKCAGCGEWNTLGEERVQARAAVVAGVEVVPALRIGEVDTGAYAPRPTGVDELDRVLGGGLVPGSVTLVGGEPGVGKSTLLTQVASSVAARGGRVLYVS